MNKGVVIEKFSSGKTAIILRVGNPDGSSMPAFIPGQYTAIGLKPEGTEFTRAYSICSLPTDPFWEFLITVVQGGYVSSKLAELKKGDCIYYKPTSKGNLILDRASSKRNIIFVGTGSGIGPFRPMTAQFMAEFAGFESKLTILQGARFGSEIHYKDWFVKAANSSNIEYLTFTSRDNLGSVNGRVTDWFKNKQLDPSNTSVFLCGNPNMIEELTDILLSQGFEKGKTGNVITESYW